MKFGHNTYETLYIHIILQNKAYLTILFSIRRKTTLFWLKLGRYMVPYGF